MRLGWISAPLTASTGYGRVTKEVCYGLADVGHQVVNMGGRGPYVVWGETFFAHTPKGNTVPVVPMWGQTGDRPTVEYYIQKFELEAVISLFDSFMFAFGKPSKPWAAHFPIDAPMTKKWANSVVNADYLVAMSQFGEKELLKHFPDFMVKMIPHGVDTKIFHPITREERAELRKKHGVPEDKFIYLFAGANFGERKCPCQLLLTFKRFQEKHPDSMIYMLTTLAGSWPNSYNIVEFTEEYGLTKQVLSVKRNLTLSPLEDEELAQVYTMADVFVLPSWGEGFGLPLIESMSCGVPVITTNASSMIELVSGHGWLIDTIPEDVWVDVPVWLPFSAAYPVPNLRSLLQCMEDAYMNTGKLGAFGKTSREFALKYDWSLLIPKWNELLKEIAEASI